VTGTSVLALATFGGMAKDRNFPIFIAPSKVTKASKQQQSHVTVACHCHWNYHPNFHQGKYSFRKDPICVALPNEVKASKGDIIML
jgi:hypothetical protein